MIVEGEYRTGHQEQLYIEPNGVIAVPGRPTADGITVYGSMQCPYYVHRALMVLLGLPDDKVRVVQTETGGGFGGKEEYPSMIAGHAALLARKAGRPVKIVYDRVEDMVATTKRHPSIVRHRTGVTRDGTLTAMDIDVLLDGGAYVTLSAVVLSRGVIHATGPYRCDHVRIRGRAVMTNTPPNGAFRGFGAPQTQFAAEVHMDRIAEAARDRSGRAARDQRAPARRHDGDRPAARRGLQRAGGAARGGEAHRLHARARQGAAPGTNRGHRPLAVLPRLGLHRRRRGQARLEGALALTERGRAHPGRSTEIGQGTRTMHAQIVADALGMPVRLRRGERRRHRRVPDSGPTVASRTCMVVGRILQRCAEEMRAAARAASRRASTCGSTARSSITKEYERPGEIAWDDDTYQGDAYGGYGWGVRRRRGRDRSRHLGGAAGRVHRGARHRQGDPSRCSRRADRGRHAQGLG